MSQQNSSPSEPTIQNVVNPRLFPEPSSIRHPELYKYISLDTIKLQQSYKNYRRAAPYLLGVLGACFISSFIVKYSVKRYIFGADGRGGEVLEMYSKASNDDYYYNREFQRMRYLTEEPVGNDPTVLTKDEVLTDLGVKLPPKSNNLNVRKKAPHYKYY